MSAAKDLYVQYAENSWHLMWIGDILMYTAVTASLRCLYMMLTSQVKLMHRG